MQPNTSLAANDIMPASEPVDPIGFNAHNHDMFCHEIRTPLSAIIGLAGLLASQSLSPEKQKECASMLNDSSNMLLELLNQLLDSSKLDHNKIELEHIVFDLTKVVEEARNIINVKAQEKGLKIHIRLGEGIPTLYIGDPLRIRQVLLNLLGNAVKFTEQGTISIYLAEKEVANGCCEVSITVADSGIGMEQEQLAKIFDKHTQGAANISRKYGGTGLGLFISQELAHLMNGDITVKSWLHMGSHFIVTLSLQKAPMEIAA